MQPHEVGGAPPPVNPHCGCPATGHSAICADVLVIAEHDAPLPADRYRTEFPFTFWPYADPHWVADLEAVGRPGLWQQQTVEGVQMWVPISDRVYGASIRECRTSGCGRCGPCAATAVTEAAGQAAEQGEMVMLDEAVRTALGAANVAKIRFNGWVAAQDVDDDLSLIEMVGPGHDLLDMGDAIESALRSLRDAGRITMLQVRLRGTAGGDA
jgi:hypothetical protein